jgi:hypothetical protein
VHAPATGAAGPDAHDRTVLIREGMNWAALVFQPLWILWHRLWWVLLGWLVAIVAIGALTRVSPAAAAVIEPLFLLWFGIVANDARRWTLERRGFALAGVVHAGNHDEAEKRWFDRVSETTGIARRMAAAVQPVPAAPPRPQARASMLPPVVGFPEARA